MTRRFAFIVADAVAGTGCLPQVGRALDGGEDETPDGGSGGAGGGSGGAGGGGGGCGNALDCASGVCASGACVAPTSPCPQAYAGCATFQDLRDGGAVVRFQAGNKYSPACVRIAFGQTVRFEGGTFFEHPLEQACGPVPGLVNASSGSSATFTFDRALGTFGYHCTAHGSVSGSGMAGAIEVVR